MTFVQSIATCFKKAFVVKGRAERSEFLWFFLFSQIMLFLVLTALFVFAQPTGKLVLILSLLWSICFGIPLLAVGIRRFRDIGIEAIWFIVLTMYLFVPLVSVAAAICMVYLCSKKAPVFSLTIPFSGKRTTRFTFKVKAHMSFVQSVSTCFKKAFVLKGRATRSEYWYFILFGCIVFAVLFMLGLLFFKSSHSFTGMLVMVSIGGLIFFIPTITVSVRRLHDLNLSGYWVILLTICNFAPALSLYFFNSDNPIASFLSFIPIVLFIFPSTKGENRFGSVGTKDSISDALSG